MNKRVMQVLQLAGMLFFASCTKEHEAFSQWVPQPMTVDGQADEWTELALNNFDVGNLSWGILNDADNIYLLLATWDQSLIRTIQMTGVILWFEDVKEKRKECGVRFSGGGGLFLPTMEPPDDDRDRPPGVGSAPGFVPGHGPPPHSPGADPERKPPPDFTRPDEPMVPHGEPKALAVVVVRQDKPVPMETTGLQGMVAMASCSGPTCSYELRIPLDLDATRPCSVRARPGEQVRILAELQVPILPPAPSGGGPRGGPGGGGMGGPMGGGMGGPMGGGMGGPMGGGMGGPMGGGMGGPPGGGVGGEKGSKGRPPGSGDNAPGAPQFETKEIVLNVNLAAKPAAPTGQQAARPN